MLHVSAEQQLVIDCVRRAFGQSLGCHVPEGFDWAAFLGFAEQQGLAPLVFDGLRAVAVSMPQDVKAKLHADRTFALLRTSVAVGPNMARALDALSSRQLEPIVLKGGALAHLAYPKPYQRTLSDIDLLLPEHQLQSADAVLREIGYQPMIVDLGHGHQHLPPYLSSDGGLSIELHHHLIPEKNPYRLDLDGFFHRAQRHTLGSIEAKVLAPADTLLHVCVHLAFGHRYDWYSLRTLLDVLAVTSSTRFDMDWDLLVHSVMKSRTSGSVYWPLRLSRELFDAPVPEEVLARLAPSSALRSVAERVLFSSYVLDGKAPETAGAEVLYYVVRELSLYGGCPPADQLRAIWHGLFPPPEAVTHLPTETTRSPVRYLANLAQPRRLARGMLALCRLLAHLPEAA